MRDVHWSLYFYIHRVLILFAGKSSLFITCFFFLEHFSLYMVLCVHLLSYFPLYFRKKETKKKKEKKKMNRYYKRTIAYSRTMYRLYQES